MSSTPGLGISWNNNGDESARTLRTDECLPDVSGDFIHGWLFPLAAQHIHNIAFDGRIKFNEAFSPHTATPGGVNNS